MRLRATTETTRICRAAFLIVWLAIPLQLYADPDTAQNSATRPYGAAVVDVVEPAYRVRRSPSMAVFYKVGRNGELIPDKLAADTIADPDAAPSRLVVGAKSASASGQKRAAKSGAERGKAKQRYRSVEAYRCEQHHLYYTNDGRCIRPAYSYVRPGRQGDKSTRKSLPPQRMQKSVTHSSHKNKNASPQSKGRAGGRH